MNRQLRSDAKRAYLISDYKWNEELGHYTYPNGKKVPDRYLFASIQRFQDKLNKSLQSATTSLIRGDISLSEWQSRISSRVKKGHLDMLAFGIGGSDKVKVWHTADVEKRLQSTDYPSLEKFARALQNGKLSEKQVRARLDLYAKGTKVSYEQGRVELRKSRAQKYGRRLLGRTDLHCEDCINYAARGWMRLEDLILPGNDCRCGANCLCSIETSDRIPE